MPFNTNIKENEETKKNILAINNFKNIIKDNKELLLEDSLEEGSLEEGSLDTVLGNSNLREDNIVIKEDEDEDGDRDGDGDGYEDDKEEINEYDLKGLQTTGNELLEGGDRNKDILKNDIDNTVYNIDYILEDDEKLINPDNVFKNVDIYIENYNSNEIVKYKKNFKQLYQTYSTKNYTISTIKYKSTSKIIVKKNDKVPKIVKELIKPTYLFYDDNNNLIKFKRQISNDRSELLYKYSQLIAKLDIKPEEKKEFEKERNKFIEKLEEYYTYTLYHKKINKITSTNKSNLVLQKELIVYNENNDYDNKILNSNIYSIDNNVIDTINKYNSENLIQYNNIMMDLSGKKDKNISKDKDKKTLDSIKLYLKQRQEIESFAKSLSNNTDIQDEYINYIILELP